MFFERNPNKRNMTTVTVDLNLDFGYEIINRLVIKCDVPLEQRTGGREKVEYSYLRRIDGVSRHTHVIFFIFFSPPVRKRKTNKTKTSLFTVLLVKRLRGAQLIFFPPS